LHRPLVLEPDALYDKIVMRRRGGLCYELNGSFAHLLRSMGFRVDLLSAAVFRPNGAWGTPFDHLTLRVALDEPWLADVGFGRDSFREPLRLESPEPQERYGKTYRIVQSNTLRVLQLAETDAWTDLYRFDLQSRTMHEYEATCIKHQTLPDAPFSTVPVVGLATLDGRITLVNRRLKIVAGANVDERDLPDDAARRDALRDYFGIVP
jgi:N-hydroxyarylamine O-acetyltransferase